MTARAPSPAKESLLLVEDEQRLLAEIRRGLESEGYHVHVAGHGRAARRIFRAQSVSALILDRMLPDGDGLRLLREFRAAAPRLPAIVVTAKDAVSDRVDGLETGADDYLVKPFAFAELVARLRALLRRSRGDEGGLIRAGDLEIDLVHRRATHADREVDLTPRQCEILAYLARYAGSPVSRETLLRDIWAEPPGMETNVVEVSINQLRRKLIRQKWPALIETVRGQGYRLGSDSCGAD